MHKKSGPKVGGGNFYRLFRNIKCLENLIVICIKKVVRKSGGLSILFHFSRLAKRGGGGYPQALPEVVPLRGC